MQMPMQTRTAELDGVNKETRQCHFSFSSTHAVERAFGLEILDHSPGSIDTSRLDAGCVPLLYQHDFERQIGHIVSYRIGPERAYGTAKMGTTPLAEQTLQEMRAGVRPSISVGYLPRKMVLLKQGEGDEPNTYLVKNWTVLEISSVSVPGDPTTQLNRGGVSEQLYEVQIERAHEAETRNNAVTYTYSSPDQPMLPAQIDTSAFKTRTDMSRKMQDNIFASYSLRSVLLEGNQIDGVERDVHRALQREKGLDAMGILVPFEIFTRDLSITGGGGGNASVFIQDTLQKTVADSIKPYSAVIKAGAHVISNQTGNFVYPRRQSFTPAGWQTSENATDTETGIVFSQLTLSACRLVIESRISKQLLEQSEDRSIEEFLKQSFLKDIGATLDAAALVGAGPGTGTSGAPLGLLAQTENTGSPPYLYGSLSPGITFGGAPSYEALCQPRYNVEQNDVTDDGTLSWITSDNAKKVLTQTPIISGFPKFLWGDDNKIAGYPASATSNLAGTDQIVLGRFSDYIFVLFAMDVFADPFSLMSLNQIRLVVTCLANCGTLRGISFARSEDSAAQ